MKTFVHFMFLPLLLLSSCQFGTSVDPEANMTYEEILYRHVEDWGLGQTIINYVSNDQDYEWYVDQKDTGTFWSVNCGPTSIEMAGRFSRENFEFDAADARALYRPEGGWWYDSDISSALTQFEIPYIRSSISNSNDLIALLDTGGIVLVNPNMSYVSMEVEEDDHAGLFYEPGTGHYLLVKGYVEVDETLFFEVYDPGSGGSKYENGELKGKNRYYDQVSFLSSIQAWWTIVYTISESN